ncbi:hypothetical protein CAEBREN_22345 [Caenorhabditis brenneri]|uniref:NR LBD domain-containing protein n=1 Tax=Caenorhabditis brenneri TaxID=135651 RepID=G0M938_CAEBE|nr:hypothetical protein CAEBREN_22345 [Caenorhabditis brenneri]
MSSENVQRHRDTFNTHINRQKNLQKRSLKVPEPIPFSMKIESKRTIDVSPTKKEICRILNDKSLAKSPDLEDLNSLEVAEYGLRQWRKKQTPVDKMDHLVVLPIFQLIGIFKNQMFEVARWLSYSKDFQKLNEDQKYQFFKLVWNIWRKFERYQFSLELFGEEAITQEKFALTDQHYVSVSLQLQFSEISNESDEKLTKCFKDAWRGMFGQVAGTLLELEPTSTEMAFMLSEICWQIAGKAMQGSVLELSEKVRDDLADNLHAYYKGSHQNYAARLIKLSKIGNAMVKFHTELKNRMEIVRIFEVFSVDLSEPDLYDI